VRWSRQDDLANRVSSEQADKKQPWPCSRILLANDDNIRVYDVNDANWSGMIEHAASNCGRYADVGFGHNSNELLLFSDFGVKLTIWSLVTRHGVEIRDPKYMVRCYNHRPRSGHMAVLTRPYTHDILMLLNPGDHGLIKSIDLPTVDAEEVLWSPDGRWLAIRDTPSNGHKVLIYTADGHLFKIYSHDENTNDIGLGIKVVEWNPLHSIFALGDYNDKVTILSKNTVIHPQAIGSWVRLTLSQFSPIAKFHHPATITLPNVTIWQEQLDASKARNYIVAPQPANPPTSTSLMKADHPVHGISILAFNSDGDLLATKSDSMPTTVWIWSLQTGGVVAVLIHHSPVKHMSWHPTESGLLLIHCAIPEPAVHLWKSTWDVPQIVTLPLRRKSGRLEASWLISPTSSQFNLMLTSTHQYITSLISSSGEVVPGAPGLSDGAQSRIVGAEDMFDEGNSLDLSPIKITHDETLEVPDPFGDGDDCSGLGFGLNNEMVDDTFHYRRHIKATS